MIRELYNSECTTASPPLPSPESQPIPAKLQYLEYFL